MGHLPARRPPSSTPSKWPVWPHYHHTHHTCLSTHNTPPHIHIYQAYVHTHLLTSTHASASHIKRTQALGTPNFLWELRRIDLTRRLLAPSLTSWELLGKSLPLCLSFLACVAELPAAPPRRLS